MQDSTRPCAHCGTEFAPPPGVRPYSHAATYCPRCGRDYRSHYRAGTLDDWYASRSVICAHDLCVAPVGRGCSKFCADHVNYATTIKRCYSCVGPSCHNMCVSGHKQARFCSDACQHRAKKIRKRGAHATTAPHWVKSRPVHGPTLESWPEFGPPSPPRLPAAVTKPCQDCGELMHAVANQRKRCVECARLHNISKIMGLYDVAVKLIASSPHAERSLHMRRAMRWRYELVEYLRERDGVKCALCAKRMRFDVSTGPNGKSDQGATVDHILPRSLGGDNELANLQLAHWACNRSKSNRGRAEQLRLVG